MAAEGSTPSRMDREGAARTYSLYQCAPRCHGLSPDHGLPRTASKSCSALAHVAAFLCRQTGPGPATAPHWMLRACSNSVLTLVLPLGAAPDSLCDELTAELHSPSPNTLNQQILHVPAVKPTCCTTYIVRLACGCHRQTCTGYTEFIALCKFDEHMVLRYPGCSDASGPGATSSGACSCAATRPTAVAATAKRRRRALSGGTAQSRTPATARRAPCGGASIRQSLWKAGMHLQPCPC